MGPRTTGELCKPECDYASNRIYTTTLERQYPEHARAEKASQSPASLFPLGRWIRH